MHAFSRLLDRIEIAMRAVACCCLMGMALLTGADVLGRGVWNTPIFGSEELTTIMATLAVALALPYAHAQNVHVGVEVVVSRLTRHARDAVKLVTDLAAAALFGLTAWRMAVYGATMRDSGVVSMNLELPTYLVVFALGFGFLMFTLFLARDVLRFFIREAR